MPRPHVWLAAVGLASFLGLVLIVPGQLARGDGDPLEEYDFSGTREPPEYVVQSRMEVHRHGLWTVQRHVLLDPFKGSSWALSANTFERINIYYGTRPMWCSEPSHQLHLRIEAPEGVEVRGHFKRAMDTTDRWGPEEEPRPELPIVDVTGGGAITLHLGAWTGAANGGSSGEIIRLSGTTPATAKVDVLWSGAYETLVDLDEDGVPEIVDTDFSHAYASYLAWKGVWTHVVLRWNSAAGRYVVADRKFHDAYRRADARSRKRPDLETAEWVESLRTSLHEAARTAAERPRAAFRAHVPLELAGSLWHLLSMGLVDEARALMAGVPLENFAPNDDESMSREDWWQHFLTACQKSRYWEELCKLHPALRELE